MITRLRVARESESWVLLGVIADLLPRRIHAIRIARLARREPSLITAAPSST